MFRRLSSSLPKDPEFPADLEKLGYFINDDDQIRSIAIPTQEFNFFMSKNERVREVHREAMNVCIRHNLNNRFASVGLQRTPLSETHLASSDDEPHIPILTSPLTRLSSARRILLYVGDSLQDLGIFAYRTIGRQSLAAGSVINFATAINASSQGEHTAIVIANLGQLIWYRRGKRALSIASWSALPRKTGVSCEMRLTEGNRVKGHATASEHVASVMEWLRSVMQQDAVVDVIGLAEGAAEIMAYLDRNWTGEKGWQEKVRAVCVGMGYIPIMNDELHDAEFKEFWTKKAHLYLIHDDPAGTPLPGRRQAGCNCFSSGEGANVECIMPSAYKTMLAFFDLVKETPGYEEPELDIAEFDEEEDARTVRWIEAEGQAASTA